MDIGLGTRLLPVVAYIVPMHCHDGMSFAGSDYPQTATTLHSPLHYSLHTQQALQKTTVSIQNLYFVGMKFIQSCGNTRESLGYCLWVLLCSKHILNVVCRQDHGTCLPAQKSQVANATTISLPRAWIRVWICNSVWCMYIQSNLRGQQLLSSLLSLHLAAIMGGGRLVQPCCCSLTGLFYCYFNNKTYHVVVTCPYG